MLDLHSHDLTLIEVRETVGQGPLCFSMLGLYQHKFGIYFYSTGLLSTCSHEI